MKIMYAQSGLMSISFPRLDGGHAIKAGGTVALPSVLFHPFHRAIRRMTALGAEPACPGAAPAKQGNGSGYCRNVYTFRSGEKRPDPSLMRMAIFREFPGDFRAML